MKKHLGLLLVVTITGLLGCSPSAEKLIPGTWQGVNGIPMTLTFGPGDRFALSVPANRSLPFPTESWGSYTVQGRRVRVLEGGEHYVGELRDGELVMVRPWGGGVSTRFRKLQ